MRLNELKLKKKKCTSDAYQCKTWYILQFFKKGNKCPQKNK